MKFTNPVVLTMTASGSLSDYADTSSLQERFAAAAGVDTALVTIAVQAGSVVITAKIAVSATDSSNAATLALALALALTLAPTLTSSSSRRPSRTTR